ncbi:hypothetical protein DM02DRAFT_687922 [Periconia macrospinosa]|uniref:ubiquitinyl hydrolase 1 n=1 Tax=Periconia macrospinosa TaxID=97972 RepID=A0A2V1DGP2_9PLEO|nr:hypothetical protein DM02DRAFT_687922 [Periconia macrospinosa]
MVDSDSVLRSLYYHLVLPPRQPGREDDWTLQPRLVKELLRRVQEAAEELKNHAPAQCANKYDEIIASLLTSKAVNTAHASQQQHLQTAFKDFRLPCPLTIHIPQQNAGLLVWRDQRTSNTQPHQSCAAGTKRPANNEEDLVVFEVFESSPCSEAVFSSDGALRIVFPGSSYAVSFSEFQHSSFRSNLAQFLSLACHERLHRFSARTRKANTSVIEPRDTTNPELITTWLATLLEANGHACTVSPVAKRVKDDICWNDGAKAPWRRLPFYLVLRVGLRRSFQLLFGDTEGRLHYKLLITKTLSTLMKDLGGKVPWDMLGFVRAKVCRRMAKLEKACFDGRVPQTFHTLLQNSFPTILQHVSAISASLEIAWTSFKQHSQRLIYPLNSRFAPRPALHQDMPSSRDRLLHLIQLFDQESFMFIPQPLSFDEKQAMTTKYDSHAGLYLNMAKEEMRLQELAAMEVPERKSVCYTICHDLSTEILNYIKKIQDLYNSFPELLSNALLNLMDLWTTLDKIALIAFPLLHDFKPVFPLNILDVLRIVSWKDMCRLHRIQKHLNFRHASATSNFTIFHDPVKGCFSERFFDASNHMKAKFQEIEIGAAQNRAAKIQELTLKMDKRREMEAERLMKGCLITTDNNFPQRQYHRRSQCPNCQLADKLKQQKISVYEHPLPQDIPQAKAAVFELCIPQAFALYRDANWSIVKRFGLRQELPPETSPGTILRNFSPLETHWEINNSFTVGLASVKKSFMQSHWRGVFLPAAIDDICLPCGIEPIYFDIGSKFPLRAIHTTPTFSPKLGLRVSSKSPFSFISEDNDFDLECGGPSSNKIISSQSKCPASLSFHEYTSFQSLFSSPACRWPRILIELGSSNMNFSNEACSKLISTLASLAGPSGLKKSKLRVAHRELSEPTFCEQLLAQITIRLRSIETNWRETHCMSMLVNLVLRLLVLCPASIVPKALVLLGAARSHLAMWMKALLTEFKSSTNLDAIGVCSQYILWSALICRRTFQVCVKSHFSRNFNGTPLVILDEPALRIYISATVCLQLGIKELTKTLSLELREAIVQDILLVSDLGPMLSTALRASPEVIADCLSEMGMISRAQDPRSIQLLPPPHDCWIEMILAPRTPYARSQVLHFHVLAGHILVDNTPQGKLSDHFRTSPVLDELFGDTSLYAVSSGLPGMKYRLTICPLGNEIHVGIRNGTVVVRVFKNGQLWEILDRSIFQVPGQAFGDLPHPLVQDCIPFLDLQSHIVELRRKAGNKWILFKTDWRLNMHNWQVARSTANRTFTLANYHGRFYQRVAATFRNFEDYSQIIVYQPNQGPLEVELRRLELKFLVNQRLLFESQKLGCEVPINQDAGCLYGLKSALLVQDVKNPVNRHVLVPFGKPRWQRRGMHVEIVIQNDGNYARYAIDPVLGRLASPAQPRLLYRKALIHALTSFIVPDPLTGRTGTEEAMYTLASGLCQPTFPLVPQHLVDLEVLRDLVPRREFYPKQLQCMQKVVWSQTLTTTVQHDGLLQLVEQIIDASNALCVLFPNSKPAISSEKHSKRLVARGIVQRARFERPNTVSEKLSTPEDVEYASRHAVRRGPSQENVFYLASLIRTWPSKLPVPQNFGKILEGKKYKQIGGFSDPFGGLVSLSSCLDIDEALSLGSMVEYCRRATNQNRYDLMFVIALAVYKQFDIDIAVFWLAFAFFDKLKTVKAPTWQSYFEFQPHQHPTVKGITRLLENATGSTNPSFTAPGGPFGLLPLAQKSFPHTYDPTAIDIEGFAQHLVEQFPCHTPVADPYATVAETPTSRIMAVIEPDFSRRFQNFELSKFIDRIEILLEDCHGSMAPCRPKIAFQQQGSTITWGTSQLAIATTHSLFQAASVTLQRNQNANKRSHATTPGSAHSNLAERPKKFVSKTAVQAPNVHSESSECKELRGIFTELAKSESKMMQQYIGDLSESLEAFCIVKQSEDSVSNSTVSGIEKMSTRGAVESRVQTSLDLLRHTLLANHGRALDWLAHGLLTPCLAPTGLLEQLRSHTGAAQAYALKEMLADYGIAIAQHQRFLRITDARLKSNDRKVSEETKNHGHGNWSPIEHPDWLLIELDGNMLIRDEQVVVARATITAELADKQHLARILVPRQLLPSTATLLKARLGGLVGRDVRHLPYSRRTDPSKTVTRAYFDIQNKVRKTAAIFLGAPEHIMSFKLCGLQHLSDGRLEEAEPMIKVQGWLNENARDIVDESDFVFSPRTALCFPSGNQTIVDGHPYRWRVIEGLLKLVESNIRSLQYDVPGSIEIVNRPKGGFPFIFFLQRNVEEQLLSRIVTKILDEHSIFPIQSFSDSERSAISDFISNVRPSEDTVQFVKSVMPDQPEIKKIIHLLRGLIVHRILLLALKKRWNVQYGVDPRRDPIAVPFNAKGVPSDQSEWGHPDVAILFTILAHYYSGLSLEQVRQSLALVAQSDDPARAYQVFIHACTSLKGTFRDWEAINTDDGSQLAAIWQDIRFNTSVVDYYLNNFVFPRHAKQFRVKLQASGWDIPLFSPSATTSTSLTTGFSGTNDNRRILPLTIEQHDLPSLAHTSAEVLTYLLQPRNRNYYVAEKYPGHRMTEFDLLCHFQKLRIRVLLDAGAQILEMSNEQVARTWLDIDKTAPAAVYFNDNDVAVVRYRQGTTIPLLVSPFAEDLSEVLVYIDESHCRGTDLMLPDYSRGALTLGMSLQKDTLIQSAMRLRQLGTTQSVVFFAPPEVHQSIVDVAKLSPYQKPNSAHIIHWLLHSTCEQLESLSPLFYSHGVDFCRRTQGALDNPDFFHDKNHIAEYLQALRQQERQSLVRLYEPKNKTQATENQTVTYTAPRLKGFIKELNARRRAFQDTGNAVHASALQEVEQEREVEVEVEVEKVREVQRPNWYQPYIFERLDQYIVKFVATGCLPPRHSAGYEHIFDFLKRTATGKKYGVTKPENHSSLYLTREFGLTVRCPHNRPDDSFLRPVQWLLWSRKSEEALLLSPEEAELIIPIIRTQEDGQVHLLTYAAPVTRRMLHFNHLSYYSIPPLPIDYHAPTWLRIEVGFFAGRIYFEWHEYEGILRFLGLVPGVDTNESSTDSDIANGENVAQEKLYHTFTYKPLAFLQDWVSARRKMQDWSSSPVGFIVSGKTLHAHHAFFAIPGGAGEEDKKVMFVANTEDKQEEEEYDDDDVFFDTNDYMDAGTEDEEWDDRKTADDGE